MKKDSEAAGAPEEITPQMIEAGLEHLFSYDVYEGRVDASGVVRDLFQAMVSARRESVSAKQKRAS